MCYACLHSIRELWDLAISKILFVFDNVFVMSETNYRKCKWGRIINKTFPRNKGHELLPSNNKQDAKMNVENTSHAR